MKHFVGIYFHERDCIEFFTEEIFAGLPKIREIGKN